jgi:hypothetical protein
LGRQPVDSRSGDYMWHLLPYLAACEYFVWSLIATVGNNGRANMRRARRMWYGMMFINMRAVLLALRYGPDRKPIYKVTRKSHQHMWYWRAVVPHCLLLLSVAGALVYSAFRRSPMALMRPDTLYWGVVTSYWVASYIPLSWFGLNIKSRLIRRMTSFLRFSRSSEA